MSKSEDNAEDFGESNCSTVYPAPSLDGLLTVGRIAKLCKVPEYNVKRWIETRRLAAFCPHGSAMFVIHPKDLQRFCEKYDVPFHTDWKSERVKQLETLRELSQSKVNHDYWRGQRDAYTNAISVVTQNP